MLEFKWDSRKADPNLLKHGVDFEEASSVSEIPLRSQSLMGITHGVRCVF